MKEYVKKTEYQERRFKSFLNSLDDKDKARNQRFAELLGFTFVAGKPGKTTGYMVNGEIEGMGYSEDPADKKLFDELEELNSAFFEWFKKQVK